MIKKLYSIFWCKRAYRGSTTQCTHLIIVTSDPTSNNSVQKEARVPSQTYVLLPAHSKCRVLFPKIVHVVVQGASLNLFRPCGFMYEVREEQSGRVDNIDWKLISAFVLIKLVDNHGHITLLCSLLSLCWSNKRCSPKNAFETAFLRIVILDQTISEWAGTQNCKGNCVLKNMER